ncbi:hypothetical protein GCM10009828_010270 [Actinoplanes couchii]|uniref:Uncharacterized protein n=1 Tax=Actinoplanes couchii TaxID=403638 RepID=A0ABQ3XIZ7_9ACTN|nr:hypothetical protein Aco03nite_068730 [Actinoplanes couchii]
MLSFNTRNRQALVDLVRLDITDHLSATGPETPLTDQQVHLVDLADPRFTSSDLGRLSALGNTLMAETWEEISTDIDNHVKSRQTARDVKKHLADHTWCGLLVGLIRWIEQIDAAVQLLSTRAKQFVKGLLIENLAGLPGKLAGAVVDIVIDRVWSALARLLEAHFPLFGEDTLRVLRMLALFACPSLEQHPEVYRYTARPLMGDALGVVSDEIKNQFSTLFTAWWRRRGPEALA